MSMQLTTSVQGNAVFASAAINVIPPFRIAFQPIVDDAINKVCAYEALVRGTGGESFPSLVAGLSPHQLMAFDHLARVRAIEQAAKLGLADMGAKLSLNLLSPTDGTTYSAADMVQTAESVGFPVNRLVIELNEDTHFKQQTLAQILAEHRRFGILTAIDDFGAGHSGLNLLALSRPDIVKIDMVLIHNIEDDFVKQSIVQAFAKVCDAIGIAVIAEGVETANELEMLRHLGVRLVQGYHFAQPAIDHLWVTGIPNASLCTHTESLFLMSPTPCLA